MAAPAPALDTELLGVLEKEDTNAERMVDLVRRGAQPDVADPDGWTALLYAARHGRAEAVDSLLRSRADAERENSVGHTALMLGASHGHLPVVNSLLGAGARVNHANAEGATALQTGAEQGRASVLEALLAARADPDAANSHGYTALLLAATYGRGAAVRSLLAARADAGHKGSSGWSALAVAAEKRYLDVVDALLERGAAVSAEALAVARPRARERLDDARVQQLQGRSKSEGWDAALEALQQPGAREALAALGQRLRDGLDALPLAKQAPTALNKEMPRLIWEAEASAANVTGEPEAAASQAIRDLVEDFLARVAGSEHWQRHLVVSDRYDEMLCWRYVRLTGGPAAPSLRRRHGGPRCGLGAAAAAPPAAASVAPSSQAAAPDRPGAPPWLLAALLALLGLGLPAALLCSRRSRGATKKK